MIRLYRFFYFLLFVCFAIYSFYIFFDNYGSGTKHLSVNAQEGKLVFQKYNCISCHQLYGLGGYMGPDLTNVISEVGKGRIFAKAFIKNGSVKMPNLNISQTEEELLLDFLTEIDATGKSVVKEFDVTWYGTVKYPDLHEE